MKEKVIDLMKNKFADDKIKTHKQLKITTKDNLLSAYRKLALYLYEDAKLTDQDELDLISRKTQECFELQNAFDFHRIVKDEMDTRDVSLTLSYLKNTKSARADKWEEHIWKLDNPIAKRSNLRTVCAVLSPNGAFKTSILNKWLYQKNADGTKDALVLINLPLSFGYSVIRHDLLNKMASEQKENNAISEIIDDLTSQFESKAEFDRCYPDIPDLKERVKNAKEVDRTECTSERVALSLNGNNRADLADEDMYALPENSYVCVYCTTWEHENAGIFRPIENMVEVTLENDPGRMFMYKRNLQQLVVNEPAIDFAKDYLAHVKNIAIQYEYDYLRMQKATKARFFEQKKNINQSTRLEMKRLANTLHERFDQVELDNEVDLQKIANIKAELKETAEMLPEGKGTKPTLRLRKLRNLHALGAYYNFNKTLAIDFRSAYDGEKEKGTGDYNVGIQSFVHEYGHYLDYNYTSDDTQLSLSAGFENILFQVQSIINGKFKNLYANANTEYLCTPTEVFARAFELYASRCGLDNDFIKDPEKYDDPFNLAFVCFTKEIRPLIDKYFDDLFPGLRTAIKSYKPNKASSSNDESLFDKPVVPTKKDNTKRVVVAFRHADQLSLF